MSESAVTLTFREKIARSNNNTILSVPNLTYRNLILSSIDFMTDEWHFEAVLKSGGTDLVKMTTSFFKHQQSLDLSGNRVKIEEAPELELCIKPKQAPRDIELMICYTYILNEGAIYYQSNDRVMDLSDSTLLVDITQAMRPTRLYIKSDSKMTNLRLVPKFIGNQELTEISVDPDSDVFEFDFNDKSLIEIVPLLKHYELKVKLEDTSNLDAQMHYLVRGFRN